MRRKLRIGVNTRLLLEGKLEGIGYFTLKNLERLAKNHPEAEFVCFFDRPYSPKFVSAPNIKPVVIPFPTRHPVLWWIYFEILLPIAMKLHKIDILFSPDGYIPTWGKTKTVATIHDINYEHDDSFIGSGMTQKYYKHFFPIFARKATMIATVSNFSKEDIAKTYRIPEDKIRVVESSANELYHPFPEEENRKTKARYTQGKDYFYFVGSLHKRKNLANIFRAFDKFKSDSHSDVKFVVVGSRKWWKGEIEDTYNTMQHKEDVVFAGRLPLEEVNRIASASIACVFVSFFEGFGVPPLEAFRSGTAAIVSDRTSLPEIGGDAAIYADPYSVESIAGAMQSVYSDPELRNRCIEKGKLQADKFSWDKTAQLVWNTIMEASKR